MVIRLDPYRKITVTTSCSRVRLCMFTRKLGDKDSVNGCKATGFVKVYPLNSQSHPVTLLSSVSRTDVPPHFLTLLKTLYNISGMTISLVSNI